MSAVFISSPEAQASIDRSDSNIDLCLETDSASTTRENASCVSENRPSKEDLRKQLIEMGRALEDSKSKNEKLEAEVEKVRAHAFNHSEKCSKLENRVFSLDKFFFPMKISRFTQAFHRMLLLWQHAHT